MHTFFRGKDGVMAKRWDKETKEKETKEKAADVS